MRNERRESIIEAVLEIVFPALTGAAMNCAFTILLTASALAATDPKTEFAFREISPTGLQLSDGGKPVFVYNFGMVLAQASRSRWRGRATCIPYMPPTARC